MEPPEAIKVVKGTHRTTTNPYLYPNLVAPIWASVCQDSQLNIFQSDFVFVCF